MLLGTVARADAPAGGHASRSLPPAESSATVPEAALERALADRVTHVEEFKGLREICAQLRVRCWLFGGTAAGYGHYVNWDLKREHGDARFHKDRFDYDYTNIFRSTQDADIVVDGTAEQADLIAQQLKERYPHFQGSKEAWEVRLLRAAKDDKEALLANPDFLNQHTDSNSTGMIEVTSPPRGESAVRDLRDWEPAPGKRAQFFHDLHEGKLHYYFSELHGGTGRARAGKNPPILSVIRYLTKAFQYELEVRSEDWAVIQRLIREFDPARDLENPYVRNWIEKNGKKLFQHAVNLEYAWNTLEDLGLRRKLIALGDPQKQESLAWWLSREPLRSAPVGQVSGRTAREIFEQRGLPLVVAHETRDFLAYESITRATTGDANVLVSRKNAQGEAAAHGEGFYTRMGRQGARGSGLTIRFELHPDAREGKDFFLASDDYVVIRNKRALRVIPESLNLTPLQFFQMLLSGEKIAAADRGLQEKLRRRLAARIAASEGKKVSRIAEYLGAHFQLDSGARVLTEFFKLPIERNLAATAKLMNTLLATGNREIDLAILAGLHRPGLSEYPQFVDIALKLLNRQIHNREVAGLIASDAWAGTPGGQKLLRRLFKLDRKEALIALQHPRWARHRQAWRWLLRGFEGGPGHADWARRIGASFLFSMDDWARKPKAFELVLGWLKDPDTPFLLSEAVLRSSLKSAPFAEHPRAAELLQAALPRDTASRLLLTEAFTQPAWANVSGAADLLVGALQPPTEKPYEVLKVLKHETWAKNPDVAKVVAKLMETGKPEVIQAFLGNLLESPVWQAHPRMPDWIRAGYFAVRSERTAQAITELIQRRLLPSAAGAELLWNLLPARGPLEVMRALSGDERWSEIARARELVLEVIERGQGDIALAGPLSKPGWFRHPEGMALASQALQHSREPSAALHLLEQEECSRISACVALWQKALTRYNFQPTHARDFERALRNSPFWSEHPELRRLCGGQPPSVALLQTAFQAGESLLPAGAATQCIGGTLGRLTH